ncbi:DUF2867 domain-containing protein [Herpetosiphon llansteffanensis]|uniref:DUF2867 domain-containing protein n=1 Tax=Herpetosiphon llansteffanensis TaxID=2094568 RepID=UPI0013DF9B0A|nr:DUF2867 domain-containing protein [Herpetosiphon llansteffanensis]
MSIQQHPILAPLIAQANHVDVKTRQIQTAQPEQELRRFIAAMIGYNPRWMQSLYAIRWGFVRLLGMRQEGLPDTKQLRPEQVPMQAGQNLSFFKVAAAAEGQYLVASASESHLTAWLAVVLEPRGGLAYNLHTVTIVRYHAWTGPVYFNVIRPFHHVVVNQMIKAGLAGLQPAA